MCTPFADKRFTFVQPDGSTIEVIGSGNQTAAVFRSLDGKPLRRNADGYFVPDARGPGLGLTARPAFVSRSGLDGEARWKQRRAAKARRKRGPGLALAPTHGTTGKYVGLCLLIQFPDVPATLTRQQVADFCNQPGYTGFGNNGSVRDYFLDVSSGKFDYSNIVAPWYTAKKKRAYYTDRGKPFGNRAQELIREALAFHKANGFDFSKLSTDAGGFVYATNVFYAGPCVNSHAEGLWPHAYFLPSAVSLGGGRKAKDYQITDAGAELTLSTFCHENGHMVCDFPDLYDTDHAPLPVSYGAGYFCLMAYGGHVDERNPARVGAYLARAAGWAKAQRPAAPGQMTLAAGQNDYVLHRRNAKEYFIIEARHRSGRDAKLPSQGLAIWKVDEAGDNNNDAMTAASHYECALMQADGRLDLEHNRNCGEDSDLFRQGQGAVFGAATTPASHWWDGTASGLEISQIGPAGPTMTFTVG
jgi:M6 family metalloprotease-like protein